MKNLTVLVIIFGLALFFNTANARYNKGGSSVSLGGGLSLNKVGSGDFYAKMPALIGFKARGEYAFDERKVLHAGFGFFLPGKVKYDDGEYAELKFRMMELEINGHYYFVGDNQEDFGMYGLIGASLNFGKFITDYAVDTFQIDDSELSTFSPAINLGIGSGFNLDFAYLFIEGKFAIRAQFTSGTDAYGNTSYIDTGYSHGSILSLTAGIRFPF